MFSFTSAEDKLLSSAVFTEGNDLKPIRVSVILRLFHN